MKTIRIGIIGAGNITKNRHLPGLKRIPGVEFVAVCNRSKKSSETVATEWEFKRIASRPEEIIRAKDIDAVLIGTWPYLHHTLSVQALRAGKHVFTQARMARNLKEARVMLRESRKHPRLVSMICPSPIALKVNLYIQKLLNENAVGSIRFVRFHSLHKDYSDDTSPLHWRQQSHYNGLNVLTYGIHMERFLQWFGPVESIQAQSSLFTTHRKNRETGKRTPVTVPDQIVVLAKFKKHPGIFNFSFSGAVHHGPPDQIEIYGDKGTLVVDLGTQQIFAAKSNETKLHPLHPPEEWIRQWTVEADFIDAIRAGGRKRLPRERTAFFPPDFEEGTRYMAVTEATVRSARTGRRIRVPAI